MRIKRAVVVSITLTLFITVFAGCANKKKIIDKEFPYKAEATLKISPEPSLNASVSPKSSEAIPEATTLPDEAAQATSETETEKASSGTSKKTTGAESKTKQNKSQTDNGTSIEAMLNSCSLNPLKTNFPELDNLVSGIFSKIFIGNMTTYQKVKAIYDYLVNTPSYGTDYSYLFNSNISDYIYESYYDTLVVNEAYGILSTNVGTCKHYSSAFVVMCRKIGLNAYIASGTVSKKGGGRTEHTWSYIIINNTEYIFDTQVQSNNKQAPYYYFGKTYSQMGTTYDNANAYSLSDFKNFSCKLMPEYDIEATITISNSEQTVKHSDKQNGCSLTDNIEGLMSNGIAAENGHINIDLAVTGGSGRYEMDIYSYNSDGSNKKLLLEKASSGNEQVSLDVSDVINQDKRISVVVRDADNLGSYIAFEDVYVCKK